MQRVVLQYLERCSPLDTSAWSVKGKINPLLANAHGIVSSRHHLLTGGLYGAVCSKLFTPSIGMCTLPVAIDLST